MSHNWDTSQRRKDPPYWPSLRKAIISRAGGLCEHEDGCTYPGQDVDHIINLANGGTDDPGNLQLLCAWHHKRKTAIEANKAKRPRIPETRPKQKHPGYL